MRITRLKVQNFRNISSVELEPKSILSFFYGDNAQGKTSLIEAIYYLSSLRSFRTARLAELLQFEKSHAQIEADVNIKSTQLSLKVILANKQRKVFVNDKATTATKFATRLKAVVFSPESLTAIKSGPDQRRDLIDLAVLQVSAQAPETQSQYGKALRQRNACLKQIRDGSLDPNRGRQILDSLDDGFARLAAELTRERLVFLDHILPQQRETLSQISGEKINLEILYESSDTLWLERTLGEIKERILKELHDSTRRVAEEALGVTLTGPHRHDIRFVFNGNDSRIFCSQGQQRALILAFKIAEIVYHSKTFGSYPLLLLDDVLSEFDEKKRNFLIDFLRQNEAQTFLTTTDQTQVLQGCSIYKVKSGGVVQEA